MVNITGLIAVVFVFVGVVLLLAIPTVFEWIVRRRFSNRFERLVRQGYVIPLLTRDILKENDRSPPRRRMTMQSLKEAWIRGQPALGAASKDWKVSIQIQVPKRLVFMYTLTAFSCSIPRSPRQATGDGRNPHIKGTEEACKTIFGHVSAEENRDYATK